VGVSEIRFLVNHAAFNFLTPKSDQIIHLFNLQIILSEVGQYRIHPLSPESRPLSLQLISLLRTLISPNLRSRNLLRQAIIKQFAIEAATEGNHLALRSRHLW
jgi:hypothetical protein